MVRQELRENWPSIWARAAVAPEEEHTAPGGGQWGLRSGGTGGGLTLCEPPGVAPSIAVQVSSAHTSNLARILAVHADAFGAELGAADALGCALGCAPCPQTRGCVSSECRSRTRQRGRGAGRLNRGINQVKR